MLKRSRSPVLKRMKKTAGELEGECSAETDMVTSAETDKTTGGQVEIHCTVHKEDN